MSIKKYSSGSWVTVPYRKYETATDTITSLPKTIIGDGQPISSYTIKGNMSQSGTPTPSNPVYPTEVGDKTANLFDYQTMAGGVTGAYLLSDGSLRGEGSWSITDYIPCDNTAFVLTNVGGRYPSICLYDSNKTFISGTQYNTENVSIKTNVSVTAISAAKYARFSYMTSVYPFDLSTIMLVEGSTAPSDYIPYGYKIPILLNGTTYPVYLAEPLRKIDTYVDSVPSTGTAMRKIYKLVLTGDEDWIGSTTGYNAFYFYLDNAHYPIPKINNSPLLCNIATFDSSSQKTNYKTEPWYCVSDTSFAISTTFTTKNAWIQYLADQYAAGTPVTVWYVLVITQTESFTAPTLPTSGTAQTFDVDTTLKPSEVSLTYHGWHEHSDEKYVGGVVNKFNKNDSSLLYSSTNLAATAQWSYGGTGTTIRIPCKSSQAYTLSCNIDTTVWRISCVESENVPSDGNPVAVVDVVRSKPTNGVYTFTTTANTKYVLFQCGVSVLSEAVAVLMLVEGSTAPSEYHPYYEWVEQKGDY